MESRPHPFVRYVPLLLLCAFPHQVFLIGAADCIVGISIAPYAVIPALALPIGAGVAIHVGRELFTERMCRTLFRVQLALSLVLILIGCTHLALLHLHLAGSYFYYLYPLQQLLLFAAYALAPPVHVLALTPQTDGAPCLLKRGDRFTTRLMSWIHDCRLIGACDAFAGTLLISGLLFFPLRMMQHQSSWESLLLLALTQLFVGSSIVIGLAHARGPLVDARLWDIWLFRFVGSVFAWPVAVGVIGSDSPDCALCLVAIGGSLSFLKVIQFCHAELHNGLQDEPVREPDSSVKEHLVLEMADQLEAKFPDVRLADREKACISMALVGMTSAQIASALGIKPATARSYFVRAYRKLGVSDFKGLVERMGERDRSSSVESGKEVPVATETELEGSGNSVLPRLPGNVQSLFALLLLMVILGDPKLMDTILSFVVVCSAIGGVMLSVVGNRCLLLPRTRAVRSLLDGAAFFSIIAFRSLLAAPQDIANLSPAALLALLACAFMFIPYLMRMVLFGASMSLDAGFARRGNSIGLLFVLMGAFQLAASLILGFRQIAFCVLLAITFADRFVFGYPLTVLEPNRNEAIDDVSHLHIDRFFSIFMLGFVVGACMQGVLHADGALGSDVMLALPLAYILTGCCLHLRRLGYAKGCCVTILLGGLCTIVAGYVLEGSARIGLTFILVTLWVVISSSRGIASWLALVHALMFGFAAGASISLMEFEIRFVTIRTLDELHGVLPASFDIEFRSLMFVGLLVAFSLYVLYELQMGPIYDAPSLEEGDLGRVTSYCTGRGATDLQSFVILHIAMGESGRQIARAAGYSVGSVNSARLSAYKLLGVHTRSELLELLRRELNMSEFPLHP